MATPTIDQRLSEAEVFIGNGQRVPAIRKAFEGARHGNEHFAEGARLLEAVQRLHQHQRAEYGDQFAATDALARAIEKTNRQYRRHVGLARVAFRDNPGAQQELGLLGERKRAYTKWRDQTMSFYDNLLADAALLAEMGRFGVEKEEVEAARRAVDDVVRANADQEREIGEAQRATEHRDEALDALAEWMSMSKALAHVLLADDPQQLEKLGIVAPS